MLTFSKSFFEQNVSVQRFLLFRNKARNAGRSGENAEMREISQNAGFPCTIAGRLTPMLFQVSESNIKQNTACLNFNFNYISDGFQTFKFY